MLFLTCRIDIDNGRIDNGTTSGTIYRRTSPYIAVDLLESHHVGTTNGEESRAMVPPLAQL